MKAEKQLVDAEGTTPEKAQEILENLCEEGFSGDLEALALGLGRNEEELADILGGEAEVDDDLLMKIRGIAQERDLEIE